MEDDSAISVACSVASASLMEETRWQFAQCACASAERGARCKKRPSRRLVTADTTQAQRQKAPRYSPLASAVDVQNVHERPRPRVMACRAQAACCSSIVRGAEQVSQQFPRVSMPCHLHADNI